MKLRPLADRVVLKKIEAEETTAGGMVDGKEITMYVNVGDKVMCPRYGGAEIKLDGVEYTVVRQSDIMAVVE